MIHPSKVNQCPHGPEWDKLVDTIGKREAMRAWLSVDNMPRAADYPKPRFSGDFEHTWIEPFTADQYPQLSARKQHLESTGAKVKIGGGGLQVSRTPVEPIANARTIQTVPDLHTADLGILEGQKETKENTAYLNDMILNHPDEPIAGGESFNQAKNRILTTWNKLLPTLPNNTLVVSNSTTLKLIDAYRLAGAKPDLSIDMKHFMSEETHPGEMYTFHTPDGKTIYGIRHGETHDNKNNLFRTKDTQLTEKGKQEVQKDAYLQIQAS